MRLDSPLYAQYNDSDSALKQEEGNFYEMMNMSTSEQVDTSSTTTMEQTPLLSSSTTTNGCSSDGNNNVKKLGGGRVVQLPRLGTSVNGHDDHHNNVDVDVNDDDDSEAKDPLLEVIDRIEDEVDHTWEELVPLEVKLEIEDKVFGWSHLSSDILGHVLFTVGAYTLVFVFLTHVVHKPERMSMTLFRVLRFLLSFWAGLSAFRMVRRRRKVWLRSAYGSKDYERDQRRRMESIRQIDRTTLLGRLRRRRELRAERKHQKKLRKAVERFQKRDQKRKSMAVSTLDASPRSVSIRSITDHEHDSVSLMARNESVPALIDDDSEIKEIRKGMRRRGTFHAMPIQETKAIGHDQILFEHGPIRVMPYAHGSFFGAAPFMLANPHWIDVLRLLMPDVYIEISLRVVHAPAPKLIHWAENNPVVAAYGTAHEMENTNTIPNLEWDVFLDPHLVHRVEVVLAEQEKFLRSCAQDDGSFQGLSARRLRRQVLQSAGSLGLTTSQRSIVAYYEAELRRRIETLVDHMLIAHGNLTQLILEQTGYLKKYNFSRVKRARRTLGGGMYARQWLAVYAEALKMGKCLDGAVKAKAASRKGEARLYSTAGISRTNSSSSSSSDEDEAEDVSIRCQCLQCNEGANLFRQQSDLTCRHRRNEESKGLRASKSFSDACPEKDAPQDSTFRSAPVSPNRNNVSPLRSRVDSGEAVSSSKALSTSIAESISVIKFISGCDDPLGIVFDIKSRYTSKQVWGLIIDYLRDAGARVEGIASFVVDEVRDVSKYASRPVKEIFFFHSAGDVQQACHDGRLKYGDAVLFNAGSLLWDSNTGNGETLNCLSFRRCLAPFDSEDIKRQYFILPFAQFDEPSSEMSSLKDYKEKFGLSIGLYCQEFAIDEAALNIIVKYVNEHMDVFDLGLSWGGVNGITVRGIQPGRFTLTDGFWNQRYAGETWDYQRLANDCEIETEE